jgi:hypothetical protein
MEKDEQRGVDVDEYGAEGITFAFLAVAPPRRRLPTPLHAMVEDLPSRTDEGALMKPATAKKAGANFGRVATHARTASGVFVE